MSVVAVAGGTGNVGRTIVDELQASGKYKPIILARKVPEKSNLNAPVFAVDYNDEAALTELLAKENVNTIISAIMVLDPTSAAAQVNLVRAGAKVESTKRFITSEWGAEHTELSPIRPFREAAIEALKLSNLEWTRFACGYFMDYFGMPYFKSYLTPVSFGVDMANKAAAIPGTGNEVTAFISTVDLAKFVVASLGLPKWETTTYCYGERLTFNKILSLAEEARGSKFDVVYDPVEKLEKGEITELPAHKDVGAVFPKEMLHMLFSMFGRWVVDGHLDVPPEKSLNLKFPEIQTTKMSEVIGAWKGH